MNSQDPEIIIYQPENGVPIVQVRLEGETVWLTQKQLAELFDTTRENITQHIGNILKDEELAEVSVSKKILLTAADGKNYNTTHYNLDMIISLGYRINSKVATNFRIWATTRLREYIIKGFAIDDERLKGNGGGDYWKELLDRIRDIRSSEKALYRQVLDLYATSRDYDPKSEESVKFFKVVQNKLHYATNQQTAAELVHARADADKDFMGLTTFAGVVPTLNESTIAKNYLTEDELFVLNRLVSAFFDLAEIKAKEHTPMHMRDWVAELDKFAASYGKGVLKDAGSISHDQAVKKAVGEYRKYQARTLSPVEQAYLDSIKQVAKNLKGKAESNER